jgi:hypothetical protein
MTDAEFDALLDTVQYGSTLEGLRAAKILAQYARKRRRVEVSASQETPDNVVVEDGRYSTKK